MVVSRERQPIVTLTTRVTRRTDLLEHALDDEMLLYDPRRQATHRLNATARYLWQRCDGQRDCAALARDLSSQNPPGTSL